MNQKYLIISLDKINQLINLHAFYYIFLLYKFKTIYHEQISNISFLSNRYLLMTNEIELHFISCIQYIRCQCNRKKRFIQYRYACNKWCLCQNNIHIKNE